MTTGYRDDRTRRVARHVLVASICAIAAGYASALLSSPAPVWAPWLLALGIPVALGSIMTLGATRGTGGIGPLKAPLAFVTLLLVAGFAAALFMPASESAATSLWLGLPPRAAVIIYGIGLLPIVILPVAYALTFDSQTLRAEDIERVRVLGAQLAAAREAAARDSGPATQIHGTK